MPIGNAVAASDVEALALVLEEHRRARSDQIEALLWIAENADDCDIDPHELSLARAVLVDIERSLDRLRDGSYGWCLRCSAAIPVERLFAAPRARFCLGCANEE
jgi:RNA polymerase-binding transcription factor DksA